MTTTTRVSGCLRPFVDIKELSPQNLPPEDAPASCSKLSCKTPEAPLMAIHAEFDESNVFSSYHWACKTCVENAISASLRRTSATCETVTWKYPSPDATNRVITEVMIRCLACPVMVVLDSTLVLQRMGIGCTATWLSQRSPGFSQTSSAITTQYFPPLSGPSTPLDPNASVVAHWRGTTRHLGGFSSYAEALTRSRSAESAPVQDPPPVGHYGSYFDSSSTL